MDPDNCSAQRSAILHKASELAHEGAHYLWGGHGEMPGDGGAVTFAPVKLSSDNLAASTYCAATIKVGPTTYVCAGRCRNPGLQSHAPQQKIAIPAGQSPDENTQSVIKLKDFIASYGKDPGAQMKWLEKQGLTPRMVCGDKITDWSDPNHSDLDGAVVWGEGCHATRHFDCGGFIQYVVKEVCGTQVKGIEAFAKGNSGPTLYGQPIGVAVQPGDTLLPSDILVYPGHVAFAMGGPAFALNATYQVAQADCAVYGVDYNVSHTGHLIGCVRLTEVALLNRPPT